MAENKQKKTALPKQNKKRGGLKDNKKTMNFARHKSSFNPKKVIPVVILVAICLAIFAKVGFLDQLNKKTAAYSTLAQKQEQLAAVNAKLTGYDEVEQMYGRYSYGLMNETEINLVSRMDVLALMEEKIASRAIVENFAVNNNVLTMNIYGITLEEASRIVNQLEQSHLVTRASVNSASADDGVEARIFISITLTKEAKEAEG